MSDKVRIGFIGVGGIAHGHVDRLKKRPEVSIVAMADPSPESIARIKDRQGLQDVPAFSDYQDMLAKVEMDGVVIASPHTLHFEQIMACLDNGCHVLTEKPMVCTQDHAKKVLAKAEEKQKILMISYQRHYFPEFIYIKDRIQSGALGDLTFVSALQGQDWLRGCRGTWRHTMELSGGGQLNDSGSHLVDIILWVTGLRAAEVFSFIENFDVPVDINSATSIRFTNGALGSISVMGDCPGWWEDITFLGKEGVMYYRNGRLFENIRAEGRDVVEVSRDKLPAGGDPDNNFIDSILGLDKPKTPGVCGLRVIELTEGAWESAKTGQPYRW
ncbi:MAG: Gfo/Idh/MocA family protein [Armatimonadota bacterium]